MLKIGSIAVKAVKECLVEKIYLKFKTLMVNGRGYIDVESLLLALYELKDFYLLNKNKVEFIDSFIKNVKSLQEDKNNEDK